MVRATICLTGISPAVSLDPRPEAVRTVATVHGRLLGANREEVEAATAAVVEALEHPLMKRAASAARDGTLRRETPVVPRLPNEMLAEGVVDVAFRELRPEGPAWTVVDFKTDRELGDRRSDYERQVGVYAQAVSKSSGEPATAWLLIV